MVAVLVESILGLSMILAWTVTLWIFTIGKWASSGFLDYFTFFTNWSWTLSALFFILDFLSFFVEWSNYVFKRLRFFNILVLYWFASGASWLVFWLVFFVLRDNPHILEKIAMESGFSLGFVLVMERVFHVIPSIAFFVYLVIRRRYFFKIRAYLKHSSSSFYFYLYIGWILLSPILFLTGYAIAYDIETIYGVTTSLGIVIGTAIVVNILFNFIPFMCVYYYSPSS